MMQLRPISFAAVLLGISAIALTGCGSMNSTAPIVVTGAELHGNVHGGQQPVSGATIQLYAAGSTGYGSAYSSYPSGGTSLLGTNVVQTDASGSFTITGDYKCPNPATTEVYLVATGGYPAGPTNPANPSIGLMAALGPCNLLTKNTYIEINEITTVASVWALSPFMTGIANIGTSKNNAQGLVNAFATVNKLANIGTGTPYGPALPAGASAPIANINEIADILASCINSAGDTGSTTPCDMLFTAATVNGVKPADTITAAMNLAQNPDQGISLAMLVNKESPFQPRILPPATLTDFALVITYSGGGIAKPSGIASDTNGNVWVANAGSDSVSELDALGITATDATGFLSGSSGYAVGSLSAPVALAIDESGNAWVANGNNTVSEVSADGTTGTLFSGSSINLPTGVAIDANNNVWVANSGGGGSVTKITAGTTPTYANYTGAGIAVATAIAIDPQ